MKMGRIRKFGGGVKDSKGSYAQGVRLGNAKSAKWAPRKDGGRCVDDDGDDIEGGVSKQRLDRPGRKHGGSVKKRADGGWVGEGDSGKALKEKSAAADRQSTSDAVKSAVPLGIGTGALAGLAGSMSKAGRFGKLASGALIASGVKPTIDMVKNENKAKALSKAGDEAEGRKFGGRARMKKGC